MNPTLVNGLVLAYLGDAALELYVREYLIESGIVKPHLLQQASIKYVCASAQEKGVLALIDEGFLSDEEIAIFKRGRNTKAKHVAKGVSVQTYQNATGFEALIGYLHLNHDEERVKKVCEYYIRSNKNATKKRA